MPSDGEDAPSDTLRERAGGTRLTLWFLLDADRRLVAVIPLLFVSVVLVVGGVVDPAPLRAAASAKDPIETLFQALTTAIITGVTLVVSLNQLVLSQELGPLGDQRERMKETVEFRRDVADRLDLPAAPPEPSGFLRALVDRIGGQAASLRDCRTVDESEGGENGDGVAEQVETFADSLATNAEAVTTALEGEQFGTFGVLRAALDFNYSWKRYEARRLREEHRDVLSTEAVDLLDALVETLDRFGPAREHIKTLYFRWELVNLSRRLLLWSIPALAVSIGGILYLDNPSTITGTIVGVDALVLVVVAATAISLVPFTLLFASVLRIATVAQRTLSIGPFILRSTDRDGSLDWE